MSDLSTNVFLFLSQPVGGEMEFRCLSEDGIADAREVLSPCDFDELYCGGIPCASYEVKGLIGPDLYLLMEGIEGWFNSYFDGSEDSMIDALSDFDESCLGLSEVIFAA